MFSRINIQRMTSAVRGMPILPAIVLSIFAFCGIFADFLVPHDPTFMALENALIPPFWVEGGSTTFLLGTDHMGRDVLSRIMSGASVSLQVGFFSIILAAGLGVILAMLSGFLGGWVDNLIMRVTDIFISLPYLMIAIVLAAALGASQNNVILVLVIIGWAQYARVLRSEVLRIREGDFILLAMVAGSSKARIMFVHIFPNIVNTLTILATLNMGIVIITEASLSFIGVGVPPPQSAWGSMLADGRNYISSAWWLCVWPGIAILLVVLSCNLLGDWLRVWMDPKFRQL